ncbi:ammonium transporter Rh type A-like [Astyanax mexicanus]|uniref:Ammonium transporter Rh type A-like n=1 Tax=Astyanax mexicanus TaxID=7994 RepID=A0A8T2LYJ0_ASTMX|nr:ammonium transporter Rh type A-like [Astyanax mexicanus]
MAPRYAPSLRSRMPPLAIVLQVSFIVLFAFFVETGDPEEGDEKFINSYANFQDVHVMVFLGFGFLASFLVRYGFSSVGFSMLVAAMAIQWATLLNGFLMTSSPSWKIRIKMKSLVDAEICASSALLAMGAVHGKTNPVQLLLMSLMEVTGFVINQWLIHSLFKTMSSIMSLHVFGTLFGVMTSWVLYRTENMPKHEKEKFDSKSGLFAMFGTLFLWMFWPSFNSALVKYKIIAYGTYLSLAVSTVTAMAVSALSSPTGKMNLVHIQGSILAGGVATGTAVTAVPWMDMTIGFCAALLATLGFRYLKGHMLHAFEIHDTRGVLNVHAIPGILGYLAYLLIRLVRLEDTTVAVRFAVNHICILLITVSMSLVLGIFTGFLIKWSFWKPHQDRKCFDDQAFWEFPHLAVRK